MAESSSCLSSCLVARKEPSDRWGFVYLVSLACIDFKTWGTSGLTASRFEPHFHVHLKQIRMEILLILELHSKESTPFRSSFIQGPSAATGSLGPSCPI